MERYKMAGGTRRMTELDIELVLYVTGIIIIYNAILEYIHIIKKERRLKNQL